MACQPPRRLVDSPELGLRFRLAGPVRCGPAAAPTNRSLMRGCTKAVTQGRSFSYRMSLLVPTPRLRHVLPRHTPRPLGNNAPYGLLPKAAHATKCHGNTDGRSALLLLPRLLP